MQKVMTAAMRSYSAWCKRCHNCCYSLRACKGPLILMHGSDQQLMWMHGIDQQLMWMHGIDQQLMWMHGSDQQLMWMHGSDQQLMWMHGSDQQLMWMHGSGQQGCCCVDLGQGVGAAPIRFAWLCRSYYYP